MKASNSAITDPCDRSRIFLKTHSVPEFVTPFPPPRLPSESVLFHPKILQSQIGHFRSVPGSAPSTDPASPGSLRFRTRPQRRTQQPCQQRVWVPPQVLHVAGQVGEQHLHLLLPLGLQEEALVVAASEKEQLLSRLDWEQLRPDLFLAPSWARE